MIPIAIMLFFLLVLIYVYYKVSAHGKISKFNKWLLVICSMSILAIADKIKLLIWAIAVSVLWVIKYLTTKKENNGRAA